MCERWKLKVNIRRGKALRSSLRGESLRTRLGAKGLEQMTVFKYLEPFVSEGVSM